MDLFQDARIEFRKTFLYVLQLIVVDIFENKLRKDDDANQLTKQ